MCLVTPSGLYLAADSRFNGPVGLPADVARKVVIIDERSICALSGLIRFNRVLTNASQDRVETAFELALLVDELAAEPRCDQTRDARWFADAFFTKLQPIWTVLARDLSTDFGGDAANPRLLAVLIHARRDGRRAHVTRIELRHTFVRTSDRYTSVLHPPTLIPLDAGGTQPTALFMAGCKNVRTAAPPLPQLDSCADVTAWIDGLFVDAAREACCAGAIGGPVDIAVIRAERSSWIRQKPIIPSSSRDSRNRPDRVAP